MTPLQALQTALAGEHAALYVFGVLGAQTSESKSPRDYAAIDSAYQAHRVLRDRLQSLVSRRGATPRAAEPAYSLPNEAANPTQVRRAARVTEQRLLAGYGQLIAHTSGADRAFAITALDASAARVLDFGGRPGPFPGLET